MQRLNPAPPDQVAERTDATILNGVDWKRVREELKECRQAAKLGQVALAKAIGVNKSTVNRIENIYGEPKHVPDLDTLERWVIATGRTMSSFFAHIEGDPSHRTEKAGVVGGADTSIRRQEDADLRALRADILHDIGNAIIASAGDLVQEAAAAHQRAARRGAKTRGPGR